MGEREGGQAEMDGTGQGSVARNLDERTDTDAAKTPGLPLMRGGKDGTDAWRTFTRIAIALDPVEDDPNFYRDRDGTPGVILDDESFQALDEFLRG